MLAKRGQLWSDGLRGEFNVVDPRSLGLIDYLEFTEQSPLYGIRGESPDTPMFSGLSSIIDGVLQRTPVGYERDGNRVTVKGPFCTLILNEQQGFTTVEYINTFGRMLQPSARCN